MKRYEVYDSVERESPSGAWVKYKDIGRILAQFRCHNCPENQTCKLAYDLYNTGDDCLLEK